MSINLGTNQAQHKKNFADATNDVNTVTTVMLLLALLLLLILILIHQPIIAIDTTFDICLNSQIFQTYSSWAQTVISKVSDTATA